MNEHRPALLRHCYRMLGSYADAEDVVQDVLLEALKFTGDAPLEHWLMRVATNACLNELASRKRRALPPLERAPSPGDADLDELERADWVTPAPDSKLEAREGVALAFIALLQRLPPRQRAALLLKDVVGFSAEQVAEALEQTVSSVNSALHRARETVGAASTPAPSEPPPPEALRAYIRAWEQHDVDGLVALLHEDVRFAMPPFAAWFDSRVELERFLRGPVFSARWSEGFRVVETRANGELALAFYRHGGPSSIQVVRFRENRVADITVFIGPEYFRGFEVPEHQALTG